MQRERKQALDPTSAPRWPTSRSRPPPASSSRPHEEGAEELVDDYIKGLPPRARRARVASREIFKALRRFNKANVTHERSYSSPSATTAVDHPHHEGEVHGHRGTNDEADCFFEGPRALPRVWNGEHQLGPVDFLTAVVKSNNPMCWNDLRARRSER